MKDLCNIGGVSNFSAAVPAYYQYFLAFPFLSTRRTVQKADSVTDMRLNRILSLALNSSRCCSEKPPTSSCIKRSRNEKSARSILFYFIFGLNRIKALGSLLFPILPLFSETGI